MTYKINLHPPVMSEEMKKELFSEDSLRKLVSGLKREEMEKREQFEMKIIKTIDHVNNAFMEFSGITVEEVEEKTDVKSYRLKVTQKEKDTLKLDWRSYEHVDGQRGKKLDDGIVFIYLNGDKEVLFGEHAPFERNERLLDYLQSVTKVFINAGFDEYEELEIVKKVVC